MKEFDDFMATKKELADLTKKSYSIIIGKFLSKMDISTIDDLKVLQSNQLQSYINGLEVSANTKNSVIRVLKLFFSFLYEWNYIESNPMTRIKKQKVGKKIIKMPTEEEIELIYNTIQNKTTLMMLSFISKLGLRRVELCSIKFSDIQDGKILVHGKGNKEGKLKLSESILKQIEDYKDHKRRKDSDYLFSYNGHMMDVSSINKRFSEMVKGLPVSEERKNVLKRIHSYRHFCGSKIYKLTKDPYAVKHVLRHSDISIGQIYIHSEENQYDNLSELI